MEGTAVRVQIDGQASSLDLPGKTSFEDVMKGLTDAVKTSNQTITSVRMNGEDITGKDWESYSDLTAQGIDEIVVETGDVNSLALETLLSLDEFIAKLITELRNSTEQFRLGDEVKGGDSFSKSIDGISVVNHTTALIQRNLGLLDSENGSDAGVSGHIADLEPIITDIYSAQQDRDWVLLADLVEYELIPYFEKHREILSKWQGNR